MPSIKSFGLPVAALVALTSAKLNVAIYGGGPTSATIAMALKNVEHINVQYFDPALNLTPTSFRLYGLSPKAWDALDLVNEEAGGVINRASWYPEDPSQIVIGAGPDAGTTVLDYETLPNKTGRPEVAVVDPAPFLMQMLNGTDKSRLHPNMTLVDISPQSEDGPVDLTFQDGTKFEADVLVADDGLFSMVRTYVLGADDPTAYPVFMNFLSAVGHVPPKEAGKLLGSPYADPNIHRRWERVGNGSWFLDAYLDGFFTCLGSFYTEEEYDLSQFVRPTTEKELTKYFKNFDGADGIIEVLTKHSGLMLIPEIEHQKPPTYVKGPVAITGSAAHTMTNFQQLGPGQQLEDGMILGTLLASVTDKAGIKAALEAYDEVRRPHAHHVAENGKRLGHLWTGKSEAGIDPVKLKQAFLDWREDQESFNMAEHRKDAMSRMAKKLQSLSKSPIEKTAGYLQGMLGLGQSVMGAKEAHQGL